MHIIITEQQLGLMKRIVESESLMLNDGDVEEYGNPSEITTSATITDTNGDIKPGKDVYGDEISKFEANNDWRNTMVNRCY